MSSFRLVIITVATLVYGCADLPTRAERAEANRAAMARQGVERAERPPPHRWRTERRTSEMNDAELVSLTRRAPGFGGALVVTCPADGVSSAVGYLFGDEPLLRGAIEYRVDERPSVDVVGQGYRGFVTVSGETGLEALGAMLDAVTLRYRGVRYDRIATGVRRVDITGLRAALAAECPAHPDIDALIGR